LDIWIGKLEERIVALRELVVGPGANLEGCVDRRGLYTRTDLILGPAVRPGVEVAAGAGLYAVAAQLLIPEQRLAEPEQGAFVYHEIA
jgi:hypothetical protein